MEDLCFYGYAEDELSCTVMLRLFEYQNESFPDHKRLVFLPGFPENKRGCSKLKKLSTRLLNMTHKTGLYVFVLTDLDDTECTPSLICNWFQTTSGLPESLVFRVAEREIESWLLADREGISSFLGIAAANFDTKPDTIPYPKKHLLNIIRTKGRKKFHREMLPSGNAHIGPEYNPKLCEFVKKHWNISKAEQQSNSLQRAINALQRIS